MCVPLVCAVCVLCVRVCVPCVCAMCVCVCVCVCVYVHVCLHVYHMSAELEAHPPTLGCHFTKLIIFIISTVYITVVNCNGKDVANQ